MRFPVDYFKSILFATLFLLIQLIPFPSISFHSDERCTLSGSLITVFTVKDRIYLFSDGRVTDSVTGQVIGEQSKVYKISKYSGMLTAGRYLPRLHGIIIEKGKKNRCLYVEDYLTIFETALKTQWKWLIQRLEEEDDINDVRVFIFLAGYGRDRQPRLFYFDSNNNFEIQERRLFQKSVDIEIGSMTHNSGNMSSATGIVSKMLKKHISEHRTNNGYLNLFYLSFEDAKKKLSKMHHSIGGKTYYSIIDPVMGYQKMK